MKYPWTAKTAPAALVLGCAVLAAARATAQAPTPREQVDGIRVSVSARGEALTDVAAGLSRQIGKPLTVAPLAAPQVTLEARGIPFRVTMTTLCRGHGLAAAWLGDELFVCPVASLLAGLAREGGAYDAEAVTAAGKLLEADAALCYHDAQALGRRIQASVEQGITRALDEDAAPEAARLLDALATVEAARAPAALARRVLLALLASGDAETAASAPRHAERWTLGPPAADEDTRVAWAVVVWGCIAGQSDWALSTADAWSLTGDGWLTPLAAALDGPEPALGEVAAALTTLSDRFGPAPGARDVAIGLAARCLEAGDLAQAHALWQGWAETTDLSLAEARLWLDLAEGHVAERRPDLARQVAASLADGEALPALFDRLWRRQPPRDTMFLLRRAGALCEQVELAAEAEALRARAESAWYSARVVSVVALVERSAQQDPQWRDKVKARLDAVSDELSRQLNMSLSLVDARPWAPPEGDPFGQMELLREERARSSADLAIGFAVSTFPPEIVSHLDREAGQLGAAWPHFVGSVVVRDIAIAGTVPPALEGMFDPATGAMRPALVNATLLHELGHAFGAVHVDDAGSVMHYGLKPHAPVRFDQSSRDIMNGLRWIDFEAGLDGLDAPELASLARCYRAAGVATLSDNGAWVRLAATRLALARLWFERRDEAAALHEACRGLLMVQAAKELTLERARELVGDLEGRLADLAAQADAAPSALAAQAACHLALREPEAAVAPAARAAADPTADLDARLVAARALEAAGDAQRALGVLPPAVVEGSADAEAHEALARLLALEGRIAEAERHWRRTLEIEPGNVRAKGNLALASSLEQADGRLRLTLAEGAEYRLRAPIEQWDVWDGSFRPGPPDFRLTGRVRGAEATVGLAADGELWQRLDGWRRIALGAAEVEAALWREIERRIFDRTSGVAEVVATVPFAPGAYAKHGRLYRVPEGEGERAELHILIECPRAGTLLELTLAGSAEAVAAQRAGFAEVAESFAAG